MMTIIRLRQLIVTVLLLGIFASPAHALLEECPKVTDVFPKKIAIFTDGTGNTKSDQTNVRRLYELVSNQQERTNIVAYYDRGVGNLGAKALGGAAGVGLARNVRQAYRCLAVHYRPGDQIYLFGFSRGAYTARVLGGLIHLMGVVELGKGSSLAEQELLVKELYEIYRENRKEGFSQRLKAFQAVHKTHAVQIEVMGVWDTVAALGLTAAQEKLHEACVNNHFLAFLARWFGSEEQECLLENASETLYQEFHQVGPEGIKKILHAVSIDEKRHAFKIELYDKVKLKPGQTLRQVWFAGVHSDIGGGYEDSDALSGITLNWMIQNLREDGLLPAVVHIAADPGGMLHTSYKGFYTKVDPVVREIKQRSDVHSSVIERMRIDRLAFPNLDREPNGKYRPEQFNACLKGQQPSRKTLSGCFNIVDD